MPRKMPAPADRYCVKCGKRGPFRSPTALQCEKCDEKTDVDRKQYHRDYHKARGAAISELIERHQKEYDRLLIEHRLQLEESATPKKRASG